MSMSSFMVGWTKKLEAVRLYLAIFWSNVAGTSTNYWTWWVKVGSTKYILTMFCRLQWGQYSVEIQFEISFANIQISICLLVNTSLKPLKRVYLYTDMYFIVKITFSYDDICKEFLL